MGRQRDCHGITWRRESAVRIATADIMEAEVGVLLISKSIGFVSSSLCGLLFLFPFLKSSVSWKQ
jgi:hypothetical protein